MTTTTKHPRKFYGRVYYHAAHANPNRVYTWQKTTCPQCHRRVIARTTPNHDNNGFYLVTTCHKCRTITQDYIGKDY